MNIGGIVVLYKPKSDDIRHILGYINKVDYMFIFDNSSQDNSKWMQNELKEYSGKYKYIAFKSNIGLCAALNYGIRESLQYGCDWTIVMDSDSSWRTDIVSIYKTEIEKNSFVALYAPVHVHDRSRRYGYEGTRSVAWAMTSGCCFNNRIFQELGGFKEELFVDGLDMDYCYYAQEKGYRVVECGMAQLDHKPASTQEICVLGKSIFKYGKAEPWRYYMQIRGLTWSFLRYKHIRDCKYWLWKWIKVFLFLDDKMEYIKNMIKGTKEGIELWKSYKDRRKR